MCIIIVNILSAGINTPLNPAVIIAPIAVVAVLLLVILIVLLVIVFLYVCWPYMHV